VVQRGNGDATFITDSGWDQNCRESGGGATRRQSEEIARGHQGNRRVEKGDDGALT
jgi:hypothetical protein